MSKTYRQAYREYARRTWGRGPQTLGEHEEANQEACGILEAQEVEIDRQMAEMLEAGRRVYQ